MALAAGGTEVASAASAPALGHYSVEAKLISVTQDSLDHISGGTTMGLFSNDMVAQLVQSPHASVLSLPSFETATEAPGTIAITQKRLFSDGPPRQIGVTLTVTPTPTDQRFQIAFENVRFEGFSSAKATTPVFNTQRLATTMIPYQPATDGYYCCALQRLDHSVVTYDADGRRSASIADANERQLLFVKITRG